MIVRAKTKRRLLLLLAGVTIAVVLIAGYVVVRFRQIRSSYQAMRAQGLAALDQKDYPAVVGQLNRYCTKYPDDVPAAYALARALVRLPVADERYHRRAVALLRRVIELQPDHLDARRLLVETYTELGYNSEALEAAAQLLPRSGNDPVALRAQIKGLIGLRRFDEARPLALRYLEIDPLNVEIQILLLRLYDVAGRNADLITHAYDLLKKNFDDARCELIMAIAYTMARDWKPEEQTAARELVRQKDPSVQVDRLDRRTAAKVLLQKAAQRVPPDARFIQIMVTELDRLGLPGDAVALLQRSEIVREDHWLRRQLIRRLWENNRFSEIDKAVESLDPASDLTDPELLAFRALALVGLGRPQEAALVADALEKRRNNRIAVAWALIVRDLFLSSADAVPTRCADAIEQALLVRRNDHYLQFFLAQTYALVGERDQAIQLLEQVHLANTYWSLPLLHMSRLLFEAGRYDAAEVVAEAAWQLAPNNVAHIANLLVVSAANLDTANSTRANRLLDLISQLQEAVPDEQQTLPARIFLLHQLGQPQEAQRVLGAALERKTAPALGTLLSLAEVSRRLKLGQEQACYQAAVKAHGISPDLAYAQAVDLLAQGRASDGLKLLEDAGRDPSRNPTDATPWRLANARFLEQANDDRAAVTWIALADDPALKDNLAVQRNALAARSVQSHREFTGRTIERIRQLTGEHAVGWRIARARWMLQNSAAPASELQQAADLLNQVVLALPRYAESRMLLAVVQERMGNPRAAIEHLAVAARLQPNSNAVALDLARLYQSQADFQRAREQIDRLAIDKLEPVQRRQVVVLLAQQGESDRAMKIMGASPTTAPASVDAADALVRVELLRSAKKIQEADELLVELLKKPTLPVVYIAADFYAGLGRRQEAEAALARLQSVELPPGARDHALGQYASRYGSPAEALARFQAAAKAAPDNTYFARSLVIQYLRMGRVADALAAAEQALAVVPAQRSLEPLRQHADLLRSVSDERSVYPLIISLVEIPDESPTIAEAIRIIAGAARERQANSVLVTKLRPLADRAPRLIALQKLLVEKYSGINRMDDAVVMATRCLDAAPTSPELAQLAAEVVGASGNWRRALVIAAQWRKLLPDPPLLADLFTAEAHLNLNDPPSALSQLQPYLSAARERPDNYPPVIALQLRALLMQKQISPAVEILWPLVSRGPLWRGLWMDLAVAVPQDSPGVSDWLNRIAPVIPENAQEERVALADAWYQAGNRLGDAKMLDQARAMLDTLTARPDAVALVFQARGVMHEKDGNQEAAATAYRRALQLQDDLVLSQNNLAMILAGRGQTDEALALATKAVQAEPRVASLYDTLAFVQAKAKDYRNAVANLRTAISLEPDELRWRLNLADVLMDGAQRQDALRVLQELEMLLPTVKQVPAEVQQRVTALRGRLSGAPAGQTAAP